jgi:hypothetical protein
MKRDLFTKILLRIDQLFRHLFCSVLGHDLHEWRLRDLDKEATDALFDIYRFPLERVRVEACLRCGALEYKADSVEA